MCKLNMHSYDYLCSYVLSIVGDDERFANYDTKVDIYSMTVSLWHMLTGKLQKNLEPTTCTIRECPLFFQDLFNW